MTRARGLRGESLESKGDRPSGASSSSSLLGLKGPFEEDLGMSPDMLAGSELARLALLTTEAVTQRQAGGTRTPSRRVRRSPPLGEISISLTTRLE